MSGPVGLTILASVIVVACNGADPLEFAAWTLPVPESVTVHEYAPVPLHQRSGRIELIEDLVIGERGNDDNYRLYDAVGPDVDADGNLYVLDSGNHRVQVFGPDGEYQRTLGREGQGPAEFTAARDLVLAGDRVVVVDGDNRRFSVWTLDGEPAGDVGVDSQWTPSGLFGFDDGTLLGRLLERRADDPPGMSGWGPRYRLTTYGADFRQLATVQDFPPVRTPEVSRRTETSARMVRVTVPVATASHAASRSGDIYTTRGEEYQVHAFAGDASPRWALRVAWPRLPITEEEIDAGMARARERIPDATRSEVHIPEHKPALSHIAVDGHGHLYVFPYPEDFAADEQPVDVYSADGEPLFTGWMPAWRWGHARGGFVYRIESDDETGEERVIRYRLVEPFDG